MNDPLLPAPSPTEEEVRDAEDHARHLLAFARGLLIAAAIEPDLDRAFILATGDAHVALKRAQAAADTLRDLRAAFDAAANHAAPQPRDP